jgi:hypothetical protein
LTKFVSLDFSESEQMNKRIRTILMMTFASVLLPMAIGAWRELELNDGADGNQTLDSAEKYYQEVAYDILEHENRRAEFAQTHHDRFGQKFNTPSKCQELLNQRAFTGEAPEDSVASAALTYQKSSILEHSFDWPAILAINELPRPVVGALKACRYTIVIAICDSWGRNLANGAIQAANETLQKEKIDWLRKNEAASCKVASKFGYEIN